MDAPRKEDFMKALEILKQEKKEAGEEFFELKSGDFHKMVWDYNGRNHRMQSCCLAMYDSMEPNDEIIQLPDKRRWNEETKGYGTRLIIRYHL